MFVSRILNLSLQHSLNELHLRMAGQPVRLLWPLVNSLLTLFIYALVFGNIMQARIATASKYDYAIIVFAGIAYWSLFTDLYSRMASLYLANAELIKKKHFSYLVFSISNIISATLYFLISLIVLIGFALFAGCEIGWSSIAILSGCWLGIVIIAVTFGISSAILTVYFPDFGLATPAVLQGLFWLAPIVYPLTILPEALKSAVELNPFAAIITIAQNCFVKVPMIGGWPSLLIPLLILGCAMVLFLRLRYAIVDEL
jgi:lipopolysaccharide transport system permease protein